MAKLTSDFTLEEVLKLHGRRFRLVRDSGAVLAGTHGVVAGHQEYHCGYAVRVEFEDTGFSCGRRWEMFPRDDFQEFFIEC